MNQREISLKCQKHARKTGHKVGYDFCETGEHMIRWFCKEPGCAASMWSDTRHNNDVICGHWNNRRD